MRKLQAFFAKPFFHDYRTLFGLWMLLPIIMWLAKMNRANNYLIYRGSFWNAVRGWNLYLPNPAEYADTSLWTAVFIALCSLRHRTEMAGAVVMGNCAYGLSLLGHPQVAVYEVPTDIYSLVLCPRDVDGSVYATVQYRYCRNHIAGILSDRKRKGLLGGVLYHAWNVCKAV